MSSARRYLRAQCAELDAKQAKTWLKDFESVVTIITNKFRKSLLCVRGFDLEDMQSVAQVAVLEACLTFNPNAGGTLRTWVGNVVRWRVAAAIEEAGDEMVVGTTAYDVETDFKLLTHDDVEGQIDARREFRTFIALQEAGKTEPKALAHAFARGRNDAGVEAMRAELRPVRKRVAAP
jgi:hypothetical protein